MIGKHDEEWGNIGIKWRKMAGWTMKIGKNMVMILKIDENWLFNHQQIAPNWNLIIKELMCSTKTGNRLTNMGLNRQTCAFMMVLHPTNMWIDKLRYITVTGLVDTPWLGRLKGSHYIWRIKSTQNSQPFLGGSAGQWAIFHCHVWLPESNKKEQIHR